MFMYGLLEINCIQYSIPFFPRGLIHTGKAVNEIEHNFQTVNIYLNKTPQ